MDRGKQLREVSSRNKNKGQHKKKCMEERDPLGNKLELKEMLKTSKAHSFSSQINKTRLRERELLEQSDAPSSYLIIQFF